MKSISWVEKYRPKNLNEITSQKEVISSLKKSIDKKYTTSYILDHLDVERLLLF